MTQPSRPLIVDPDLPVIDSHHHVWVRPEHPYRIEQFEADVASGHNIVGSVFAECHAMYRTDGPAEFGPVGEASFVAEEAERSARGLMRARNLCSAFIGTADLTLGSRVNKVLDLLESESRGRFRGIRCAVYWDPDPSLSAGLRAYARRGLLLDPTFREGFRALVSRGFVYDAWQYEPQLPELCDLVDAFPDATVVVNHCGGPVGINAYATPDRFSRWRTALGEVARRPNTMVKLSGLSARRIGLGLESRTDRPSAEELAKLWIPYLHACVELFGPSRCMWGSNFPVDVVAGDYATVLNAYKLALAGCSSSEKRAIFADNARRVYEVPA
jgi:L-fuconolactonase